MKRLLPFLLVIISISALGQDNLDAFFSSSVCSDEEKLTGEQKIALFIKSIPSGQNDSRTLRKVFMGLHSTFLKKYEPYSDFNQVFTNGNYDCLTATALFSYVLDRLDYTYEIIETNYHIFMVVKSSHGDVLIETTDRMGGLVTGYKNIESRIRQYQEYVPVVTASGHLYQYPFSLFQKISAENLTGLLFFNQAVKAFNRHEWLTCANLLERSGKLYGSPRCDTLGCLLIQVISESSLEEKIKAECLVRLKAFALKKSV